MMQPPFSRFKIYYSGFFLLYYNYWNWFVSKKTPLNHFHSQILEARSYIQNQQLSTKVCLFFVNQSLNVRFCLGCKYCMFQTSCSIRLNMCSLSFDLNPHVFKHLLHICLLFSMILRKLCELVIKEKWLS